MEDWDPECADFMSCAYGCDAYYGDRSLLEQKEGEERLEFIRMTRDKMYSDGITQAKRCELMKCHAFCAKKYLDTCREWQFRNSCTESQPQQYGCDVDCSGASRHSLLLSVGALLYSLWNLRLPGV